MTPGRILVADDEQEILVSCRKILQHAGHEVATASNGAQALEMLKSSRFDVLLLDLKMPGRSGMEILPLALGLDGSLLVIMFTAYATLENAVNAVKAGAFDYLAKPFTADQLRLATERALQHRQLLQENLSLRDQLNATLGFGRILGSSAAMQKVMATLQKVVRSDANILIEGETGTGKELVARTVHAHSLRRDRPFVPVDCAALPENLLESELFGHEKGAFTGADRASRGLLEAAHTGTLFLDEIGELSPALQVKLLRTLQERELRHVGGQTTIPIDIRIIAATNRDLRAEIAARQFREDLYYRLNVVNVRLPALRERRDDIMLLANEFLQHFCQHAHTEVRSVSPDVAKLFLTYHWPGNVRELQNAVQHAVLLSEGDSLEVGDLPEYLGGDSGSGRSFQDVRESQAAAVERPFLIELLKKHRGNVSEAAAEAGMTRKMIYRLASKFQIDLGQFRGS